MRQGRFEKRPCCVSTIHIIISIPVLLFISATMIKPVLITASILLSASLSLNAADFTVSLDGNAVSFDGRKYTLGPSTILLSADKKSSPYSFTDALEAIKAVNSAPSGRGVTLLVAPSVYWLDNPDDPEIRRNPANSGNIPYAAEIKADTLSIIGLSDNPADVVFAVNRGQTQGALGNFTMLHFFGKSLTTENMTFGNYCNVDLDYPLNPSLNRQKRREAIVQAQLGICERTDRLFSRNCRFISRLNLCPLIGARRSLYKDCYFECTDDALTGSAVYLDCRFTFYSGKPFYSTASTGAVFLNCDIHSLVNGTQYLTKAPGMVTLIDTRFTAGHDITLQWTRDASPVRCYQSNVTLNGTPVTVDASRPELSTDISKSPLLKAYKITLPDGSSIYNTPNLLAGDDSWDPLGMLPAVREAEKQLSTRLTSLPVALQVTPSTKSLAPQDDHTELTPSLRLWGDYEATTDINQVRWQAPTALKLVASGGKATATSANLFPREIECIITATTTDGLTGATAVTVAPFLKDAPHFTAAPSITVEKSALRLNYTLSTGDIDDCSIVWYRSTTPELTDSIPVRHGNGSQATVYPLTAGDIGYYLSALVFPKHRDSRQGEASLARLDGKNLKGSKSEKTLSTSFAEIPIRSGEPGRKGFWHFDTYKPADTQQHDWTPASDKSWYYGKGADAATGLGLVQATRGARLSYTPVRDKCRDMSVSLIAEPSKGPGQGFGSATGQYMDICLKFDPVNLTGYALRIERTPDYDKAVTFTLVSYDRGTVRPISEPVATSCFRTPCNISIDITNNILTARASTDATPIFPTDPAIKSTVTLTAPVSSTDATSIAIQHTGSVGASATLLRNLKIDWK